jgi:hypothetical protein
MNPPDASLLLGIAAIITSLGQLITALRSFRPRGSIPPLPEDQRRSG